MQYEVLADAEFQNCLNSGYPLAGINFSPANAGLFNSVIAL